MNPLAVFAVASVVLLSALAWSPDGAPEPAEQAAPERHGNEYVLVIIRTGPATDLTDEARREAFAGHFSNMKRMGEAGDLLIAGPFGPPLGRDDHRGLFVIDRATAAEGLEVASSDPTTKAGVFVLDAYAMTTDDALRELPRLEKEDERRRLEDPDVPDEWAGRAYVLATAPFDETSHARAAAAPGVAVAARVHGWGEGEGDLTLLWLDATTPEEAHAILPEGAAWTLHGWYGSKCVGQVRE